MAKSQMQVATEGISRFYQGLGILDQNPDAAAIELLKLSSEEAKEALRTLLSSIHRAKIYTSLNLLSQKIQVLFESLESV